MPMRCLARVGGDGAAAERLPAGGMLRGPGADDMPLISGGDEGKGLLPDPPVERHGKILDQDQDMRALAARPSASRHRSLGSPRIPSSRGLAGPGRATSSPRNAGRAILLPPATGPTGR